VPEIFDPKGLYGKPSGVHVCTGEVIGIHIDEAVMTDGLFDNVKAGNVSRLGYLDFSAITETFAMRRPKWKAD
jgi:flavin reductase (DIM6/NTAB) family NADH-FMN oxidoreductase RutF